MAWKRKHYTTKYCSEMCDTIISVFENGGGIEHFCSHYKISRSMFENYLVKHEEFKEAYAIAKNVGEKYYTDLAVNNIVTDSDSKFNNQLFSLMMANKFGWTKDRKVKVDGIDDNLSTIDKMKKILSSISKEDFTASELSNLSKLTDSLMKIYEAEELEERVSKIESAYHDNYDETDEEV